MSSPFTQNHGKEGDCRRVAQLLPAFMENALDADLQRTVRDHLRECPACRRRWQEEEALVERLVRELPRQRPTPSGSQTWRMRHEIEHGLRRESIMTWTKQTIWGAAALALFAVVIGVFFWWQAGGGPTTDDTGATPAFEEESDGEDLLAVPDPTQEAATRPAEQSEEVPPGERAVVQFAIYEMQEAQYAPIIEAFEEENPDVDVRIVYIQDIVDLDAGVPEDFVARLAANADVSGFFAGVNRARQGLVLDLRPLIEADPTVEIDDFYPGLLQGYEWQGGIWGVPIEATFDVIAYQKEAFDAAGLPYPRPGWTWEEFLQAAKTLTRPGQWGLVMPLVENTNIIEARSGPLWDGRFEPPRLRLDDPQVIEATRWYVDLFLVHEVAPYLRTPEPDESGSFPVPGSELIYGSQAAMWLETTAGWQATRRHFTSKGEQVGVAPFPVSSPDDRTTRIGAGSSMGISAGSQNPQAAWRWISYLTGRSVGNRQYPGDEPSYIPARRSVVEATDYWERVDPELGETVRFALDHSYAWQIPPNAYTGAADILESAFTGMLTGQTPVEVAMVTAQAEMEAALADWSLTQEEATPVPAVAAPEPEPELAEGDVTLTFVAETSATSGRRTLQGLAETFQETHPGIFVDVQAPNFSAEPQTLLQAAQNADCMQWHNPILNWQTRQTLLNVDPFLDAGGSVSRDDFYPVALAPFTAQGQLWGLPASVNVTVLAYDRDLFDAAGVPYPTAQWTPQQFQETAIALTQGEGQGKQYGFMSSAYELGDLLPMLERAGARLVQEGADLPVPTFDDPSVVEAMRWYTALTTQYGVKPVFTTSFGGFRDQNARRALRNDERVAMWSDFAQDHVSGQLQGNAGYAPLPAAGADVSSGFQSTSAYFISAEASQEARQACWQWISFLSNQPDAVDAGLPARRDLAQSDAYRQLAGPQRADAYMATMESSATPGFQTRLRSEDGWGWLSVAWYWLGDAYDGILNEGMSVENALAEAQEAAEAFRSCLIARGDEAQEACLRDVDPELGERFYGNAEE